jgi:uncharacterized protein with ATP-grasp and redox domains
MMTLHPIRTDESNAFAHATMTERLPGIIREVQDANDLPPATLEALDRLHEDMLQDAEMPLPALPAPDADMWRQTFTLRRGETWLNTAWFFAETYFFRQIVDRVRYWQTQNDPFAPMKQEELDSDSFAETVATALEIDGAPDERLQALTVQALWGNQSDLSHSAATIAGQSSDDDILVNQAEAAVAYLHHLPDDDNDRPVHLIADNAGTELGMDLLLTAELLQQKMPVIMHLKMHPTYVSDATVSDVHQHIAHPALAPLKRLFDESLADGRLRLAPDFFWNSPHFLAHMPPRLHRLFENARLLILKGDANYRRAVNDTIYPVDTPLDVVLHYLPAPLLALRTLKSDPVLGITQETASHLDDIDEAWRVNGERGVIQFVP